MCGEYWLFSLKVAKFDTVDVPRERMTPIDFEVTWSNVKVKLLVFEKPLSSQYLLIPLLENRQIQYSGCRLRVDDPSWCSDQMVKIKVKLVV